MAVKNSTLRLTLVAAALMVALAGCQRSGPDAMLASGKEYQAKGDDKAAVIQFKNALQAKPDLGEARLLLGRSLIATGDLAGAEKELRRALELQQAPEVVMPLLANALIEQGRADVLLKDFAQKKLADPAAEAAYKAYLGDAMLSNARLDDARRMYAEALSAEAGNARARTGQARLLAAEGKLAEALAMAQSVMKDHPQASETGLLVAELFAAQGDRAASRKALSDTVSANEKFVPARLALVQSLLDANELEEAGRQLEQARPLAKNTPRFIYTESLYAMRKGDAAKAKEGVAQVLKAVPDYVPALVLAGLLELNAGQQVMAQTHLARAVALAPAHSGARRLLAASYLRSAQPNKAQETLQPVLETGARDPGLLLLAGEAYLATGDVNNASRFFKAASAAQGEGQDARRAAAHVRMGQIQLAGGRQDEGLKALEEAAALDSNQIQSDLTTVTNYLTRKEFDKALAAANQLVKRKPELPMSYFVLGQVYGARGDGSEARKAYDKALQLAPGFMPAAFALGQMDVAAKNPSAAKARYEAMIERDPKLEAPYLALADVMARSGSSRDEVIKVLQRAIAASPTHLGSRLALINLYLTAGESKAALPVAREAASVAPNDPRVLLALAMAQEGVGDLNQSIESLNKLVQVSPRPEEAQVQLAAAYARQGQYDKAVEILRKLRSARPGDEGFTREIVTALLRAKKPEEALAEARAAQKTYPKSPLPYALEGEVLESEGKLADAEAVYRKGATALPEAPLLAIKQHALLVKSGRQDEADAFAAKWLKAHPRDVGLPMYLGERELAAGKLKAAATRYKAVIAIQPDNVIALNNLAWVGGELGDPQAIAYAERAYRLAPQNAQVSDTLGSLLVKKGDVEKGLEYQARAVQLVPAGASLRLNYARSLSKAGKKDLARKELETIQSMPAPPTVKAQAADMLKTL